MQTDPALHRSQTNLSPCRWCRYELGNRVAVPRDYHGFPALDRPDELGELILGLDYANVHAS